MPEPCNNCDPIERKRPDYLLWGSTAAIAGAYLSYMFFSKDPFSASVFELLNRMALGLTIGIIFVGFLQKISNESVQAIMGQGGTLSGILRATAAGVLLDLCSHGILLVGMQLYRRGLSLGQTMAFLIASPWNSFSLTLILWSLIGLKWTLAFIFFSMAIAIISGLIFSGLVKAKILPKNPNTKKIPKNFSLKKQIVQGFKTKWWTPHWFITLLRDGLKGSRMILRWIFFGIILAAAIRTFITPDQFEYLFGPSIVGLGTTVFIATLLEVCSEGSTPIAADILTRAGAPGNSFAFLMTGVATDYTELISLKETTKSWKISFFLPLITLPQVIILALLLNYGL